MFIRSFIAEYFVVQLNSVEIIKNVETTDIQFEEFKIFTVNNNGGYYCCIRTEEISNYKVFIKQAHAEIIAASKQTHYTINLLDEITVFWSTNFHLKTLLLVRDILDFKNELYEEINATQQMEPDLKPNNSVFSCNIVGLFGFYIVISEKYSMNVSIGFV